MAAVGASSIPASLYTIGISVQPASVGADQNGLIVQVADCASLRRGTPAPRHALVTLASKARATYTLPPTPVIVTEHFNALLPPTSTDNRTNGASWCYQKVRRSHYYFSDARPLKSTIHLRRSFVPPKPNSIEPNYF